MLSNTRSVPGVPASQPIGVGQWDSSPQHGTAHGTASGTVSLKALAARVLKVSQAGQHVGHGRDRLPEKCPTGFEGLGQSSPLSQVQKQPPQRLAVSLNITPLEALARFERDPVGVVHWLAQQEQGQPPHLVQRWAAAIRAEARQRLMEEAE